MDKNLELAKKRTILACKRTLLSFIRTSLLCLSVALAFVKLDKSDPVDIYVIILSSIALIFLIVGIIHYFITVATVNDTAENEE